MRLLKARLGYEGIGIYTALLIRLSEEGGYEELDETFIADEMRCNPDLLHSILFDFDLFIIDGEIYRSAIDQRTLSEKRREAGRRGGNRSAEIRWGNAEKSKQMCKQSVSKSKQNNFVTKHDVESVCELSEEEESCKQNVSKVVSKSKQKEAPLSSPLSLSPTPSISIPPIIPPENSEEKSHTHEQAREGGGSIVPKEDITPFVAGQTHQGGGRPWAECLYREGQEWRESIAMLNNIPIESINQRIAQFILHQTAHGQRSTSRQDAKSHFSNWLRIVLQSERKQHGYEDKYQRKERESTEARQHSAYVIATEIARQNQGFAPAERYSTDVSDLI